MQHESKNNAPLSSVPSGTVARRYPGRNSLLKIDKITKAARKLFVEKGFGATSMDAVATLAGVGKATVYAHFNSKETLFAAVITLEARSYLTSLNDDHAQPVAVVLERLGFQAFDLLTSPTSIAAYRAVSAEALRFPDLGRLFFETGPAIAIRRLADRLQKAMERGELRQADSYLAATQFLAMMASDHQIKALLGVGAPVSDEERGHIVMSGVDLFLRGYRP